MNTLLRFYLLLSAFFFISGFDAWAQTLDFVNFSPSPMVTAIGGAGSSIPLNDAYNFFYNPAQLVYTARTNNLMTQFYLHRMNDVGIGLYGSYSAFPLQIGYDLKKIDPSLPVTVGIGYMHAFNEPTLYSHLSYLDNPEKKKYPPDNRYNMFALGLGADYYIHVSAGIAVKDITTYRDRSTVSPIGDTLHVSLDSANGTALDFGFLLDVPIIDSLRLWNDLSLGLNLSFGYSVTGSGKAMEFDSISSYFDGRAVSMTRITKMGYGLHIALNYRYNEEPINIMTAEWTSEGNDFSSNPGMTNDFESRDGSYYARMWDAAINLKNSRYAYNRHGYRVSLLEMAWFGGGRTIGEHASPDYWRVTSNGFGLETKGILKLLKPVMRDNAFSFVADHVSMNFSYCKLSYNLIGTVRMIAFIQTLPDQYIRSMGVSVFGF